MRDGDQVGQARVGQPHEAARRDAVGHVAGTSRATARRSRAAGLLAEQLGVQGGHAVDAKLPTAARCAIRTRFSAPSSMSDSRATRASSPGKRVRTSSRKRAVDLVDDLQVARQHLLEEAPPASVSSASGSSVWQV